MNVITEMLDSEKEVDVFLAVRRVRTAVPFFIDIVVRVYTFFNEFYETILCWTLSCLSVLKQRLSENSITLYILFLHN